MRSAVLVVLFLSMMVAMSQAGRWRLRRPWEKEDEDESHWDDEEESWVPGGDRDGQPCTPPQTRTCGEADVSVDFEECDEGFGVNVCNYELTIETRTLLYEYDTRCFFGGFGCVSVCACTDRCEGDPVIVTRRFVDCCENFTTIPFIEYAIESFEEGRRARLPTRFNILRSDGCPIEMCPDDEDEPATDGAPVTNGGPVTNVVVPPDTDTPVDPFLPPGGGTTDGGPEAVG